MKKRYGFDIISIKIGVEWFLMFYSREWGKRRFEIVKNDEKVYGSSKERIELIFDAGTFVELGAYTKRAASPDGYEGAVCGYGSIDGRLVFAFIQDNCRAKGAFGERQAKKIAGLYDLAIKNGAPVVGIFDSAGTFVSDGAASLAAYGQLYSSISAASGVVPQIALIDGICGGSLAVAAAMFDFVVTVKNKSEFFVNPPFVVGPGAGSDELAGKSGQSAYTAESVSDAASFVKKLLAVLPDNNAGGAYIESADDANRKVRADVSDLRGETLALEIADAESFIRLYENYTQNTVTGFASFGGIVCGIIASGSENGGALDIKSARIIAKLVSFCDAFNIPVVTLVDSAGLDVNLSAEESAYASELARLSVAYTSSTNAKVTVITGKAYGAAFTLLGSKSVGADIVFALPTASVGVLSPKSSVAFLWNDRVGQKSREELEAEWQEQYASACAAAKTGEIDDVIEPSELRQRIAASISMLEAKSHKSPERKHMTLPL